MASAISISNVSLRVELYPAHLDCALFNIERMSPLLLFTTETLSSRLSCLFSSFRTLSRNIINNLGGIEFNSMTLQIFARSLIFVFFVFAAMITGIVGSFIIFIRESIPPVSSLPERPSTSSKNNSSFLPNSPSLRNIGKIRVSIPILFLLSLAFNSIKS
jgi:hypothetical protein